MIAWTAVAQATADSGQQLDFQQCEQSEQMNEVDGTPPPRLAVVVTTGVMVEVTVTVAAFEVAP